LTAPWLALTIFAWIALPRYAMNNRICDPISSQLEAYEESWQSHHVDAMMCRHVEQGIAVGLSLFQLLKNDYDLWRRRVATGEEALAYREEHMRGRFAAWLRPRDRVRKDMQYVVSKGYEVDNGANIERCFAEAQQILDTWISPVRSRSHAFEEHVLDDDEADRLEEIKKHGPLVPGLGDNG